MPEVSMSINWLALKYRAQTLWAVYWKPLCLGILIGVLLRSCV